MIVPPDCVFSGGECAREPSLPGPVLWPLGVRGRISAPVLVARARFLLLRAGQSGARMFLEHALLTIKPGQEAAFEAAMRTAVGLISATQGFKSLAVRPCVEKPGIYLLLVEWESIEAHETGFRKSVRYGEWSRLLHGFYNPFPEVLHFGPAIAEC